MTSSLKQFYYDQDYYNLKLEEVIKTDKEIFEETIYKLSRKELPIDLIQSGLSNFSKTIHGPGFGFLNLNLSGHDLYSLRGVEKFKHLHNVDVSDNKITELEPLNQLSCLIKLDASHNLISNFKHFKPSEVLVSLKLGFNKMTYIPDMKNYPYLRTLEVNNNEISYIEGISTNKNLRNLDLSNNSLEIIENLDTLDLFDLNLEGNKIVNIGGLRTQKNLQNLNISRNQIKKLDEIKYLVSLRNIDISSNMIRNLKELEALNNLEYLMSLDLAYNFCQKIKFYKIIVLYILPQIRILDGVRITEKDLVKAEIFYGHDIEEKKRIFDQVLPSEEFIDRRIFTSHMLDPDSEDEPADYDFFDKYDEDGAKIEERPKYWTEPKPYPFGTGVERDPIQNGGISMQFVNDSVMQMQESLRMFVQKQKEEREKSNSWFKKNNEMEEEDNRNETVVHRHVQTKTVTIQE